MAESNQNNVSKSIINSARELLGLLGAFAGIFVALLYVAGRYYAYGYFGAMNIPEYMISYSTWEYGAAVWRSLFIYTTGVIAVAALIVFFLVIAAEIFCAIPLVTRFANRIKREWRKLVHLKSKSTENEEQKSKLSTWYGVIFLVAVVVFLLVYSFSDALRFIQEDGRKRGQLEMLQRSKQVELITNLPIVSGKDSTDNRVNTVTNSGQYIYDDFKLLTMNNGKYYIFKELDPDTCKPAQVYVINTESIDQLIIGSAESLSDLCEISE